MSIFKYVGKVKNNSVFEEITLGPFTAYLVKPTEQKYLYADKPHSVVEFKVYVEKNY